MDQKVDAGGKEYAWQGREFAFHVRAETEEGLKKKGTFVLPEDLQKFTVTCDEGTRLGGTNSAPTPLGYFLLGAGFCALTQLTRYAEMMKVPLKHASVDVKSRFRTDGSVLRETVKGSALGFELHIHVESDAPEARIAALIRAAEAGCFAMQTVINPTEVTHHVTLNGKPLDLVGK
jgi:uncharacterized OsmC-like protein